MVDANATPKDLAQVVWTLQETTPALSETDSRLSSSDLESLAFSAFYASLTVDEGRPARFRLSVTDRVALLGLNPPLDVSSSALRKLAMTCSASSYRAIAVAKQGDALRIIGYDDPDLGTRRNSIDWAHGQLNWSLMIEVTGPGCLSVFVAGFPAGVQLREGRIKILQLMSHVEPVKAFYEAAGETIDFEYPTFRVRLVRYFWTRILRRIWNRTQSLSGANKGSRRT